RFIFAQPSKLSSLFFVVSSPLSSTFSLSLSHTSSFMGFGEKSDLYNVFMDQSDFAVGEFVQQSINQRCRLFKEYKEVQREKLADPDIQLVCDETNIFKWTALIKGPSETPYEGGVFQLAFAVPENYPLQPPQVRFLTKIFHPNVHFKTGEICLDILKNAWSPAWTLQSVKPTKIWGCERVQFNGTHVHTPRRYA
ncbi:hypothetical protein HID58_084535, partial [Brassica napus]